MDPHSPFALLSRPLLAWLATFALHSSAWLSLAWLLTRGVRVARLRDLAWKAAALASVLTPSLALAVSRQPAWELRAATAGAPAAPAATHAGASGGPIALRAQTAANLRRATIGAPRPAQSPSAVESGSVPWTLGLAAAWLLGAGLGVARLCAARRRLLRAIGPRARVTQGPLLETWCELARGYSRRVRLTRSRAFHSPITLMREVCLPERAETELGADERRGLLAHELAHVVRRDPQWLLAVHALERVFFFQPLFGIARRRLQHEMELASDDWAVRRLGRPLPVARCLARVAEWLEGEALPSPSPLMAAQRSTLVLRVERLVQGPPAVASRRSLATLAFMTAAGTGAMSMAGPRVELPGPAGDPRTGEAAELAEAAWQDVLAGLQAERAARRHAERDVATYRIASGDLVRVVDFQNREGIDARELVTGLGTVLLPHVGVVEVAGLAQEELRAKLKEAYAPFFASMDLHVQVLPREEPADYFVLGAVERRGRHAWRADLTLFEALTDACPGAAADLALVRVIRADPVDPLLLTCDLRRMAETGDTSRNVLVARGDILFVPEKPGAEAHSEAAPGRNLEGQGAVLDEKIRSFVRAKERARAGGAAPIRLELGADGAIRTADGKVFGAAGALALDDVEAWLLAELGREQRAPFEMSERPLVLGGTGVFEFSLVQRLLELCGRHGVYRWEFQLGTSALGGALPSDLAEIGEPIEEGAPDTARAWSQRPIEVSLRVEREGRKVDPATGAPYGGEGPFAYDASRRLECEVACQVGRVGDEDVTSRAVSTGTIADAVGAAGRALAQLHERYPERAVVIDAHPGSVYSDVVAVLDAVVAAGFTDVRFVGPRR